MSTPTIEELNELPHIDCRDFRGRDFPLLSFYDDDGQWHMWSPDNTGKLMKIIATPIEAAYFAAQPAKANDLQFLFHEFAIQRASWGKVNKLSRSICSDLHNLGASLAKLRILHNYCQDSKNLNGRLAATELEYVFLVCRSLFDLVQETITELWRTVEYFNPELQSQKRQLPTTFKKLVLNGDKILSVETIAGKWNVPTQLAQEYQNTAEFFVWLRDFRDFIIHGGTDVEVVFVTKHGFAVDTKRKPFSEMTIWDERNYLPDNPHQLGSLRSVVGHVILKTFSAFEHLIIELQNFVEFPPKLAPKCHVYICGPFIEEIAQIPDSIHNHPWYT